MLKKLAIGLALVLLALPATAQDFEKGFAAAQRGDFATALREWAPLAKRGECRCPEQSWFDVLPLGDIGTAAGGRALVTAVASGEADQDRCQGRAPWPLHHFLDGRGCRAEKLAPEDLEPD